MDGHDNASVTGEIPNSTDNCVNADEETRLQAELAQVEDDIQTLKATLTIKVRRANEIRKRLGQTTLSTLQYDFMEGIHKIEDTEAFIKTSEFLGKAKDKTLTVAQETREKVGSTISAIKNSSTVKTLSESVGSTYETVKLCLFGASARLAAELRPKPINQSTGQ
ncbi:hypothetical protein P879_10187 [Paragonimus westermani]|uniref:Tumor protein D52 n=1 Tax=Paragonimus westermani TaxID=34504 RepID=A0A8T0CZL9_9TREM|nr:hypothetical protein P879_10187 [Paragonimus westermani]